jgi:hypothetical protein
VKIMASPLQAPSPPPSPPFGAPLCPKIGYSMFDPVNSIYCSTESTSAYVHCQSGEGFGRYTYTD